jgi:hypothetical protein
VDRGAIDCRIDRTHGSVRAPVNLSRPFGH